MSDDLRRSLSQLPTAELADIVARRDPSEWLPEVFPIAEAILHERSLLPPEPASESPGFAGDDDAALSKKLVGLVLATDRLRESLSRLPTRRLAAIVGRHDDEEWRPEVFPVAESILRQRGAIPPVPASVGAPRTRSEDTAVSGDLVRLVELPNPSLVPLVKSLLARGRFRYFITNEEAQGLFAVGQVGLGYNPITGPPSLFVERSGLDEARELLAPLFDQAVAHTKGSAEGNHPRGAVEQGDEADEA
jgi:hypothetical protein